ncbi:MAG: tRNA 2-thiouridine(34) synthase MnmA [Chlamydiales bacterium]|jgi:tRNA-specific 2-thiouridylase|nr:tRNA 2-thiouridine(34) synthase MnmA [Chlamydiales bacterium]
METEKERLVIAMSGGVDSSVCASMMVQHGYDCVGMTMRLWKELPPETEVCSTTTGDAAKSCCGAESVDDARLVAESLGMPYYAVNMRQEFWEEVVQVFAKEYFAGRTPSPCILCNEKFKFHMLYRKAKEIGASKICTGHYARIEFDKEAGRWNLLRAVDPKKDQSYFLFSMTQDQLANTLFPLGGYTKDQIRQMAGAARLVTAKKPESMDICFIPDGDYSKFIERNFPQHLPGKGIVKDEEGNILGSHEGIHTVTVGQRKGLGIAYRHPLYVKRIHAKRNEVIVGSRESTFGSKFTISRVNWICKEPLPGDSYHLNIRIRSRGPESPGTVYPLPNGGACVVFDQPQHAITPGQAAVFYDGERVFGGGWIDSWEE